MRLVFDNSQLQQESIIEYEISLETLEILNELAKILPGFRFDKEEIVKFLTMK